MEAKTEEIIDLAQQNKSKDLVNNTKAFDVEHERKVKTIWKAIGKVALLVLTILTFARVPIIGSYLDGLFDYLLGIGKYPFYVAAIIIQIGLIFNIGFTSIIKTKRFVIFSLLGLLCICCIISGVTGLIYSLNDPQPFSVSMHSYHSSWFAYFKTWNYSNYFHGDYKTGGILAELIGCLFTFASLVVLIVVAAIILVICIFVIINVNYRSTRIGLKIRGWMIRKLGGTFRYDGYNELRARRDNQNKFKKVKRATIEATALTNESIPFDLLPQTDVDKFNPNFKHARQLQNKLDALFRNSDIDCLPSDINIYSSYTEICFEAKNKTEINKILKLQSRIAKVIKLDHFNISIRGSIINIEIENVFFSKFSLKTVFNMYDIGKDVTAVFGINRENKISLQNFRNNSSALILGKKGSGSSTLAVLMLLSTCFITSPDNLDIVLLNPNCESTYSYFNNLPHSDNKIYESVTSCTDKLHEVQKWVNERNSLLKVNNVENIDQYNHSINNTQQKIKHIIVLISNFEALIRESFQNNKIIADILTNGRKAGIYLILQSYAATNDVLDKEIFENVSDKYILTLSSKEESLKIFNNSRGYQLHNNGDCLYFGGNKINNMKRIQIANINYNELTTIIDLIKTFYATRDKKHAEELLAGEKDETR